MKFVTMGPIKSKPAFTQKMDWHWTDDKPLIELMMSYFIGNAYMGQYQIVVHFGYGSTMKYFVNICVFSLI